MTPEPQSDESLFLAAAQLSAPERITYLARECAGDPAQRQRLESLLAAHDQAPGSFLQPGEHQPLVEPLKTILVKLPDAPADEAVGQTLGRYKLMEKIGEGGCGVVYVAEQREPVKRRVALKIIKLGMDTKSVIARFEAERQALALMDHPNIAKVLDGGATVSGRPYFVMELVRGIRITDYCDQASLSTKERLDLFIKVCQAVQHAHQKGIIHRDIKPSNILVTLHDGVPVPKVIDFGIAKATEQRLTDKTLYTELHSFMGTPAYMSPEQAEMSGLDIDTRADIYSLGVLLYELLSGKLPFEPETLLKAGLEEIRRTIREVEPPKPSTRLSTVTGEDLMAIAQRRGVEPPRLSSLLRGDLDWIVMKALEKERARRYDTASAFAEDLRRHLRQEPVVAAPPSTAYRMQRFVRRNKAALVTASAFVVVLLAGTGISVWEGVRASQQARFADARRREADASRQEAGVAQTRAERSAQEASRLLLQQYEREGTRLLNERDLTGSLVYFTEALRREEGDSYRARLHRLRIALVLGQCPELKGLLVQPLNVSTSRFTADGSEIVSAANFSDVTQVRVWEAAGLKPVAERISETGCKRVILSPGGGWFATYDQVGLGGSAHAVTLWNTRQPTPGLVLLTNSENYGLSAVIGFSRDDHRVVVANEKAVRVWDTAQGLPLGKSLALTNRVGYAALSADGKKLALCFQKGQEKGEVLLLNADTLASLAPPLIHDGSPLFAGFDATGQRLITTSFSGSGYDNSTTGEARVWDARSGEPLTPPLRHDQAVYQAELSPDGGTLVTVTGNPIRLLREGVGEGQMHFWGVSGKASPRRLSQTLPLAGLVTAKFATDGKRVLAGRHYEVIETWWNWAGVHPPDSEGFSLALGGAASGVFGLKVPHSDFFVSYSPDGQRCLVSDKGRALQIWQLRATGPWTNQPFTGVDGRPLPHAELLAKSVIGNKVLLMGSRENPPPAGSGRVTVVDTGAATVRHCIVPKAMRTTEKDAYSFAIWRFSADGQRIGMCRVVQDQSRLDNRGRGPQTSILQMAVWRSDGGDPIFVREARQDGYLQILDAIFDKAERFLLALKTRDGIRISDGQTGVELRGFLHLEENNEETDKATFSADGSRLLVEILRSPTPFPGDNASRTDVLNFLAHAQTWLHIWRLADETHTEISFLKLAGEAIGPGFFSGKQGVSCLAAFSSDARRAVVNSGRNSFRIWDLESQSPLTPHLPLEGTLHSAEFSRDGKFLLTRSGLEQDHNVLRLWHAEIGDPLSPPLPAPSVFAGFERCSFEGAEPVAVVGYGGSEMKRWSLALSPDPRPVQELVRLAQWLSGRHLDASGALTKLDTEAWQALAIQIRDLSPDAMQTVPTSSQR